MGVYGSNQIFLDPISAVVTTAAVDVGTRRIDAGGNDYVYVYNGGGADISIGRGCVLATSATNATVTVSSVSMVDAIYAVALHATITTGAYAWALKRGFGKAVMASADSAAVGFNLCAAGNGLFRQVASGSSSPVLPVPCARILSAAASGASDTGAYFYCP